MTRTPAAVLALVLAAGCAAAGGTPHYDLSIKTAPRPDADHRGPGPSCTNVCILWTDAPPAQPEAAHSDERLRKLN